MSKSKVAQTDTTKGVTREDYEAWRAEQERAAKNEATGSPELVALRKLVRTAESVFEFEGYCHRGTPMTPLEILGEALRCAQSDFAVIGDSSCGSSGMSNSMVFRRAELRIDLALALAEYRTEFDVTAEPEAEAAQ